MDVTTSSLTGLPATAAVRPYVRNVFIHSRRRCLQQRNGLCSGCTALTAEVCFLLLREKFRSSAFLPEFCCSKIQFACVNNPASFVGKKLGLLGGEYFTKIFQTWLRNVWKQGMHDGLWATSILRKWKYVLVTYFGYGQIRAKNC